MKTRWLVGLFAASLVVAACGGSDSADPKAAETVADETDATDATSAPADASMDHSDASMDHADGEPSEASAADIASGFTALQNGHHAAMKVTKLDAKTQAELDTQLAVTREVAKMYP